MTEITTLPLELKGYIYKITSLDTHKCYIGQTLSHEYRTNTYKWKKTGLEQRWNLHQRDCKEHPDRPLYQDINKYGIFRFTAEIIKTVNPEDINKLDLYEFETIKELNTKVPNGYNTSDKTINNYQTKRILLKYFNKKNIEPEYKPKTRSERRQQVVVRICNRDTFFLDKELSNDVNVSPINAKTFELIPL
jgi:hypothetical protein